MEAGEILNYMDSPRAAEPLHDALNKALTQDIPEDGLRPSTLFTSYSHNTTPLKQPWMPISSTPAFSSPAPVGMESPTMGYETPLDSSTSSCRRPSVTNENIHQGQASLFDTPNKVQT